MSAATHEGLRELGFALADVVEADRASRGPVEPQRIVLTPKPVDEAGFVVERDPDDPDGFVVRGAKPERWVRQTAFDNDEAVGYLADRLAKLGIMPGRHIEVLSAGAADRDVQVRVGGVRRTIAAVLASQVLVSIIA